ncbi:hypothetical protein, partial [Limosilactobacillus mucosae]|uniref:hypothetical protein n=1 Tax=Limosilactobacillus mucosae TaxID=97478 RepID=UPI0022E69A1D
MTLHICVRRNCIQFSKVYHVVESQHLLFYQISNCLSRRNLFNFKAKQISDLTSISNRQSNVKKFFLIINDRTADCHPIALTTINTIQVSQGFVNAIFKLSKSILGLRTIAP